MRKLTKSQKKILDMYNVGMIEDLPNGVMEQLEKINNYEILYQDANRYLSDKFMRCWKTTESNKCFSLIVRKKLKADTKENDNR